MYAVSGSTLLKLLLALGVWQHLSSLFRMAPTQVESEVYPEGVVVTVFPKECGAPIHVWLPDHVAFRHAMIGIHSRWPTNWVSPRAQLAQAGQ